MRIPSPRCAEAPAQDVIAEAYRAHGYGADRWKIGLADIDEQVDLASNLAVTKTLALSIAGWCGLEPVAEWGLWYYPRHLRDRAVRQESARLRGPALIP